MSAGALQAHLETGTTTVCRVWALTRRDGVVLGFTDHDGPLAFDGIDFQASTGLTTRAIEQSTGLSVDNSEAIGVLSDVAIKAEHIRAGLYDGAELTSWLVNWQNVDERRLVFRGSLGEIERTGGAFRAELRGLAEALNRPGGRVYQRGCGAILGDSACGVDMTNPAYRVEADIVSIANGVEISLPVLPSYSEAWFERGAIRVLTGASSGAVGVIKRDRAIGDGRFIETWEYLGAGLASGDRIELTAGCDKRAETCRVKFANFLNFRGFPDIPGEDWLVSYPVSSGRNDGGSRRS